MKQKRIFLLRSLFIILLFIIVSPNSFCQTFILSEINSTNYSLDRIAQQVYFKDFFSDTVRVVDLKNLEITNTGRIALLPFFGNKQHIMLYGNNSAFGDTNKDNIYLYNLEKQSYHLITDTLSFPPFSAYAFSFSPNDSNFISFGQYYLTMEDTSLKPLDGDLKVEYSVEDAYPQWSSDTSFVFISGSDGIIAEYFLKSKNLDTLAAVKANILGFAYNVKYNILAYSTSEHPSKVYFHYKNSDRDSLIFSPVRDDPDTNCWDSGYHGIISLCWSPDNKKLAFAGKQYIDNFASGIYIYSLDSSRTYIAAACDGAPPLSHMEWVNNDTLIYVTDTDKHVYIMDVSSVITSVDRKEVNEIITDFNISNYPNPFNNSTKITVTLPNNTGGSLFIYNVLGRLVKRFHLNNSGENKYEITWNGINDNNNSISSGFYLGVLKSDDPKIKNTKIIKMIYLK